MTIPETAFRYVPELKGKLIQHKVSQQGHWLICLRPGTNPLPPARDSSHHQTVVSPETKHRFAGVVQW